MAVDSGSSCCSDAEEADGRPVSSSSSSTAAAFWRWRVACVKARYRVQLQQLLSHVAAEEQATAALQHSAQRACAEEERLRGLAAEGQRELAAATQALLAERARSAQLQAALDRYDAELVAPLAAQLQAQADARASELEGARAAAADAARREAELKAEQLQLLAQLQELLAAAARSDEALARATADASAARREAAAAREQAEGLEAALRATGARATAAEDGAHAARATIVELQRELAELTERYNRELAHAQPLRAAGAEAGALRERAAEASAAAAALAATRNELRRALDEASAGLAAAHERCRQLEATRGLADELRQAAGDGLTATLAQQLEAARAQLQQLAPQLAAAEITVQQQRRHIEQLSGDVRQAQAAQAQAADRSEVVSVLNARLQAGLRQQQQQHQAGGGAEQRRPPSPPPRAPAAADMALLLSQLQEQASALLAAERAVRRQAAAPGGTDNAAAAAGKAAAVACHVVAIFSKQATQDVAVLAATVAAAAVEVHAQHQQLSGEAVPRLQRQMRAAQEQPWQQGVLPALAAAAEAVAAARQVCAAADASRAGSDGAAPAVRSETAMQQVAHAEAQLASVLGSAEQLDAADSAALPVELQRVCAAADASVRAAGAVLLELADCVRCCDDDLPALASSIVEAEAALQATSKAAASAAAALSRSAADAAAALTRVQPAEQAARAVCGLLQQLERLLLAGNPAVARRSEAAAPAGPPDAVQADAVSEAAAMQLEVAALTLTLKRREQEVQELRKNEERLLSGNLGLVPAELLLAARNGQDEAAREAARAAQQLEQAAAAQQVAAGAYVDRAAARRQAAELRAVLLQWRLGASGAKAERLASQLAAAAGALERSQAALTAFCDRIAATTAAEARLRTLAAVLAAWRQRGARQQHATWAWHDLAQLALAAEAGGCASERCCFMRRLRARRRGGPAGSCAEAAALRRLLAAGFSAWRHQARIRAVQRAQARLDAVSAGLPAWIAHVGDRRRLERAWLAWRLAAVRARGRQQAEKDVGSDAPPSAAAPVGQRETAGDAAGAAPAATATTTLAALQRLRQQQQQASAEGEPRWQIRSLADAAVLPQSCVPPAASLPELPDTALLAQRPELPPLPPLLPCMTPRPTADAAASQPAQPAASACPAAAQPPALASSPHEAGPVEQPPTGDDQVTPAVAEPQLAARPDRPHAAAQRRAAANLPRFSATRQPPAQTGKQQQQQQQLSLRSGGPRAVRPAAKAAGCVQRLRAAAAPDKPAARAAAAPRASSRPSSAKKGAGDPAVPAAAPAKAPWPERAAVPSTAFSCADAPGLTACEPGLTACVAPCADAPGLTACEPRPAALDQVAAGGVPAAGSALPAVGASSEQPQPRSPTIVLKVARGALVAAGLAAAPQHAEGAGGGGVVRFARLQT